MSSKKKKKKKKTKAGNKRRVVDVRYGADAPDGMCFQLELVLCGNPRCLKCPAKGPCHGPYWYAYWKQGGRTRTAYIGRELDLEKASLVVGRKIRLVNKEESTRATR